jgi:hypothetical protein
MLVALLLLPGILILFSVPYKEKSLFELIIYSCFISICYYISLSAILGPLHISMTGFIYLTMIIASLYILIHREVLVNKIKKLRVRALFPYMLIVFTSLFRFVPMLIQVAPAGIMPARKAEIASRIISSDGARNLLLDHDPVSLWTSIVSLSCGITVTKALFLILCSSFVLISLASFVLLSRYFKKSIALFSSVILPFLLPYPQYLIGQGNVAGVFLLSLIIFMLSFALGVRKRTAAEDMFVILLSFSALLLFGPRTILLAVAAAVIYIILLFVFAVIMKRVKRRPVFIVLSVILCVISYTIFYLVAAKPNYHVTKYSQSAYVWIDRTLNAKAVIAIDSNGSGVWIPAMTGRSIVYEGNARKAVYIYVDTTLGVNSPLYDKVLDRPYLYRRVYSNPEAQIWKVL